MTLREHEQELEALLAEQEPYIHDHGFTERVLAALPPRRRRTRMRAGIVLTATFLACLLGLVFLPGGELGAYALVELVRYNPGTASLPVVPLVIVVMGIWGGVAAARSELQL